MPRTRSLAWAELKIGLVSIFALVMATLLIFLLSGSGGFFWQRYSLKTLFTNIAGLKEGRACASRGRRGRIGQRVELHRRPRRGRHGGEQGPSGADHVDLGRFTGVGVAAGRGGRRHHRRERGHADSGVGVRAFRPRDRNHRRRCHAGRAPRSNRPLRSSTIFAQAAAPWAAC